MSLIKDTLFKILLQSDFSVIIKFSQVSHEYQICQPNLSDYWLLFWRLKTKYDFGLDVPANENPYLFYRDNYIVSKLNSWAGINIVTPENYKTIDSLYLCYSNLKEVSPLISKLVNLQILSLDGNKLEQLPASFGQLVNLQRLYIFNNQLEQLPTSFGQLVNLQELGLSDNKLEQLPANFGQLVNLQTLYIYNNKLTQNQINLVRKNLPNTNIVSK